MTRGDAAKTRGVDKRIKMKKARDQPGFFVGAFCWVSRIRKSVRGSQRNRPPIMPPIRPPGPPRNRLLPPPPPPRLRCPKISPFRDFARRGRRPSCSTERPMLRDLDHKSDRVLVGVKKAIVPARPAHQAPTRRPTGAGSFRFKRLPVRIRAAPSTVIKSSRSE